MRIALLTIWHCYNYGAELQTYATVRALQELGHEVEVIDYRLEERPKTKSFIKKISLFLHFCAPVELKFHHFWRKYIPSTKHYTSIDDLQQNLPEVDMFIVGSDQVWNPQITLSKVEAFFLTFVPVDIRCASYASSFGTDEWLGESMLTDKINKNLARFVGVSCREKQGCNILKETFGIDATLVVDPTLLHTSYSELTGIIKQKHTLAYYQLYSSPELMKFAKRKAIELGLDFVDVNEKSFLTPTFVWNRRTVQQWIRTIAESSFVITHSFHGVAMCLLYHKQFVVIYDKGNRISRIKNILKLVELENRLFTSIEQVDKSKIWNEKIDFYNVDKLLSAKRATSWNFLKDITN